jgi:hypothetical protein
LSEDAVRGTIAHGGQFNIIHPASGLKNDLMLRKDAPCERLQVERRHRHP